MENYRILRKLNIYLVQHLSRICRAASANNPKVYDSCLSILSISGQKKYLVT